jgi:hypothetical protein
MGAISSPIGGRRARWRGNRGSVYTGFEESRDGLRLLPALETEADVAADVAAVLRVELAFGCALTKPVISFDYTYMESIWNRQTKPVPGFGKHGDSAETRSNSRSPWDTIRPGRREDGPQTKDFQMQKIEKDSRRVRLVL